MIDSKLLTVEDPGRVRDRRNHAVPVNEAAGMNFSPRFAGVFANGPGRDHAGEIRDLETSQIAIQKLR